ncbi:YveK family protein [Arthrobacter koreensis]|uniref:YveK family protein n=1 Tax=Arthrobacter koreensis TaxID=199136 RepID=UPI002DBCCC74|nr:Wzz/FepE/Etk N-terminal domain-containing protein [Arthrobacter koreensis]MEB7505234.1 Wzz/FepE/Etk N-terminal domain-containing protein [Arthrobacter koreensis]
MELSEYLLLFRRRLLLILFIVFLAVDAAILVSWVSPKSYEARADLFVKAQSSSSSSYEDSQFTLQRVKNYPDLVRSPQVLVPVAEKLGNDMTASSLAQRVSAENPKDTVYVRVTASAASGEEASVIANLVAESLADQIRLLENDEDSRAAVVDPQITVPADPPAHPSSPDIVTNLVLGAFGGLFLGLLAAIVTDRRGAALHSAEDVVTASGVELIGRMPVLGRSARLPLRKQVSADTELRSLLTRILLRTGGQLPRIVLATGACQRSTVSGEMMLEEWGRFIADSGRRVCVLQGDDAVRTPFGLPQESQGFTDLVTGTVAAGEVVRQVGKGSLFAVAAGSGASHLATDTGRDAGTLIKELAEDFDVLLTLATASSVPLNMEMAGAVSQCALVLVSYGSTTEAQLDAAVMEMRSLGIEPLGIVMLDVPAGVLKGVLRSRQAAPLAATEERQ